MKDWKEHLPPRALAAPKTDEIHGVAFRARRSIALTGRIFFALSMEQSYLRRIRIIRVATGKIVAGKVVLEGEPFEDGTTVAVIATDDSETFELTPEHEAELLEAIAEIDRGEFVGGADLLRSLKSRA